MKSQYIHELRAGETVKDVFMLTRKILKEKKDGGSFAILEFTDNSGSIEGVAWEPAVDNVRSAMIDDLVFISGTVNEYNDRLQITVQSLKRVDGRDAVPEDFIPACPQDIDKVKTEIGVYRRNLKTACLKNLIAAFFDDINFERLFFVAPAAKRAHHAYLGGLAVHTLSMLKLVMHVQSIYSFLDLDLLIAGCLLHDVGKIYEYSYTKKIDMSTPGKLLGHIMIGCDMVSTKIRTLKDFPDSVRDKLLHMILSHHGSLEWGSPRMPMFAEALVLHHIDNMDSKIAMFREELEKNQETKREWSDFHTFLERELYLR
ncbi:HD domain-containing protein [candidate division WOR-3 bacterium]|nr:HD domain-containing protein [candidate division WOR-3 bacterium]